MVLGASEHLLLACPCACRRACVCVCVCVCSLCYIELLLHEMVSTVLRALQHCQTTRRHYQYSTTNRMSSSCINESLCTYILCTHTHVHTHTHTLAHFTHTHNTQSIDSRSIGHQSGDQCEPRTASGSNHVCV